MFSLPKLDVGSLSLNNICKNSCANILFGIVLAVLVMVVLQSLDSEISPSFPMFKSQNNLCLKQMDIINEKCLFGILDNPIIIFMFIYFLSSFSFSPLCAYGPFRVTSDLTALKPRLFAFSAQATSESRYSSNECPTG